MKHVLFVVGLAILMASCARPMAKFSYDATKKIVAPTKVMFVNTSMKADKYLWDFGDGQTSTEASPTHEYAHSGNYLVKLTASKGSKSKTMEQTIQVKAPEKCLVEIQTDLGNMTVELFNATPKHRDNFLKLADEGYYDGTLFHRVIAGFMIQGGDPNSKGAAAGVALGMGGPGYQVPAEFVDSLVHIKGSLAAARMGDGGNPKRESSGSQFYVVQGGPVTDEFMDQIEARTGKKYTPENRADYKMYGGTPHLDFQYTVFGRVTTGLEVVDKVGAVPTARGDRPLTDLKMKLKVIK
jgi:cyclophilin family peptidyl-prolyl cis-trans isomerase